MKPFATLARQFRFNNVILDMATGEFDAGDWSWHPEAGGNPAHWILGHVAYCRRTILEQLGQEVDSAALESAFGRGSQPGASFEPAVDVLAAEFQENGERISELLRDLTGEDGARDLGREMPDRSNTVGGYLHFMHVHETLHLGQLQYLGRARGKAGIP